MQLVWGPGGLGPDPLPYFVNLPRSTRKAIVQGRRLTWELQRSLIVA